MSKTKTPSKQPATPRQKAWIGRLRPELHRFFPDEERHLDIRVAGPPELHANSRIYPFTLLADGLPVTDILVKVPQGREASDVARTFRANQLMTRHFSSEPHLHVPEMLGKWEDPPALIMKKAMGDPMEIRIRECRNWAIETGCQLAQHFVERAGQWLGTLHNMPVPDWSHPRVSPIEEANALLDRLRAFDIDPLEEKRIRDQISILAHTAPGVTTPLHGDYTILNVLCQSPQDITVLGTDLATSGDPAMDIGWFLASLHNIDKWQIYAGEMAYTTAVIKQTAAKFKTGYQSIRELPEEEVIQAWKTLKLLKLWLAAVEQQRSRNIAGLRTFVIRRINQHFVRAMLR